MISQAQLYHHQQQQMAMQQAIAAEQERISSFLLLLATGNPSSGIIHKGGSTWLDGSAEDDPT